MHDDQTLDAKRHTLAALRHATRVSRLAFLVVGACEVLIVVAVMVGAR